MAAKATQFLTAADNGSRGYIVHIHGSPSETSYNPKLSQSDAMSSTDFGEYNPLTRQKNVKAKLDEHFARIRTNYQQQGHTNSKPKERDSVKVLISDISDQVNALSRDIEEFKGPHFTQKYRTLNVKCVQFQLKLDKIEIEGRMDAKQDRKSVLVAAEAAAKLLASKVHPDGKVCPDCELKKL